MIVSEDLVTLEKNLKDEAGSPPHVRWFSAEHLPRRENLIGKLQTSDTKERVSRYNAIAEGICWGFWTVIT